MTWTATIVSCDPITPVDIVEMYDVAVQFDCTDGRKTVRKYRLTTRQQLENAIRNQLATFNGIDLDALALGPIDVSQKQPDPPTADQIKAREYTQKRAALIALKQDVELGLAAPADLAAAVSEVIAAKPVETAVVAEKV